MRHASSRALFDYWDAQRGNRPAPERGEIEPGPIRRALADTFILAFDRRAQHPVRLAGTRMCAMLGRELNGVRFVALWDTESRRSIADLLDAVVSEPIAAVAGARGTTSSGETLDLELLVLPLAHRGRYDVRVMGVLSPLSVPAWLGLDPLKSVSLGPFRFLDATTADAPEFVPGGSLSGRRRRGLTVYDGGRS